MNWSATFLGSLSLQQNLDFCLRILIALLCGGAIGFERSRHFNPLCRADGRRHCLQG